MASETRFHTREQVGGYLSDALELMREHHLPPVVHDELLIKLVDLLSQKHIMVEQPAPIGIPAMAIPGTRRH